MSNSAYQQVVFIIFERQNMKFKILVVMLVASAFLTGCQSKSERQFVRGCQSSGADSSVCECIYSKMEDKYGEEGFKDNLYTLDPKEDFQRELVNTTLKCAKE